MRKISTLALLAVFSVSVSAFADEPAAPETHTAAAHDDSHADSQATGESDKKTDGKKTHHKGGHHKGKKGSKKEEAPKN